MSTASPSDLRLAALCAALALVGMALLAVFSRNAQPTPVDSVTLADEGRLVEFVGRLTRIQNSNGNYFLVVCGASCSRCVVFKSIAVEMNRSSLDLSLLEAGKSVSFEGVVREYQGSAEIVALNAGAIEVLGG